MPRRAGTWLAAALSGGAMLLQMGCRGDMMRELSMLAAPEALNSLLFVPRSNFVGLLRLLWG
jgi:hypothetical protein